MKKNCILIFLFLFSSFIYAQSGVIIENRHFELKKLDVETDFIEVHPEILSEKIYSNPGSVENNSLVYAKGVRKYVKATFDKKGKFTTKKISAAEKNEFDRQYERDFYSLHNFSKKGLTDSNLPKPIYIFMENLENINGSDDFYFHNYDEKNRLMLFIEYNYKKKIRAYKLVFWNEELNRFTTYDFDDYIIEDSHRSHRKISAITEDAQYAVCEIEILYKNDSQNWKRGLMLGFINLEKLQKGEQAFVLTNQIFSEHGEYGHRDYGNFIYHPQKGWAFIFAGPDKKRKQNNTVNILYMRELFD